MNSYELYENKKRGSPDFPVELYRVDASHPRYRMPLHWHLEHELILVRQGSLALSLSGRSLKLRPGDCVWIDEGVVHGGIPDECVYDCIVFSLSAILQSGTAYQQRAEAFLTGYSALLPRGSETAALAARIFDVMGAMQTGCELMTVGLLWQLIGTMLSAQPHPSPSPANQTQLQWLKKVLSYIRTHYDAPVTLEELAAAAGMSPRYFCRVFARVTGKTPIAYLNYYRIEAAGERLLTTDDSITSIAFSCGFNDASYFSKTFLREKGLCPSRYRMQNRDHPHRSD